MWNAAPDSSLVPLPRGSVESECALVVDTDKLPHLDDLFEGLREEQAQLGDEASAAGSAARQALTGKAASAMPQDRRVRVAGLHAMAGHRRLRLDPVDFRALQIFVEDTHPNEHKELTQAWRIVEKKEVPTTAHIAVHEPEDGAYGLA